MSIRRLALSTLPLLALALSPAVARASIFFIEPGAALDFINSNVLAVNTANSSAVFAPEGQFRAGLERENMFASADVSVSMMDLRGVGAQGFRYTLGITGGGTFVSVPIRLYFGIDLLNNYQDSTVSLDGTSFRLGMTYFLSERIGINLLLTFNNYSSIGFTTTKNTINATGTQYGSVALGVTFPFYLKAPRGAWRPQHDEVLDQ